MTTALFALASPLIMFLCTVHLMFCVLGLSNPTWFGTELDDGTGMMISPYYWCLIDEGKPDCILYKPHDFYANEYCRRSASEMKNYFYSVRAMVIVTGSLAALTGCLTAFLGPLDSTGSRRPPAIICLVSFITAIFNAAGCGLGIQLEYRMMCGQHLCDLAEVPEIVRCYEYYHWAAYIYFCSLAIPVINMILSIIPWVAGGRPWGIGTDDVTDEDDDFDDVEVASMGFSQPRSNSRAGSAYAPGSRAGSYVASEYSSSRPMSAVSVVSSEGGPFVPPDDGDWEWDPNSKMYWSDNQYLFMNPDNGHFYDPDSAQWYNSQTEEWYV